MDASCLSGQRILLILVNRGGDGRLQLALGKVLSVDRWLDVEYSQAQPPIRIRADYVASHGVAPATLSEFLAPVPGRESVEALARNAAWCVPILVAAPVPSIALTESPFHGMALQGKDELILLRPGSELEADIATWNEPWQPDSGDEVDEPDDEEEGDPIVPTSDAWKTTAAPRPLVRFRLHQSSDQMQRRHFITDLMKQRFPLHDAGLLDPDPAGFPGWVSLKPGAAREDWMRLVGWLRAHPAMAEILDERNKPG